MAKVNCSNLDCWRQVAPAGLVIQDAASLPAETLPEEMEIAGQQVYAPVVEADGTLIVDTGLSVLELAPAEVRTLRGMLHQDMPAAVDTEAGDLHIFDTGRALLELFPSEAHVLAAVLAAW